MKQVYIFIFWAFIVWVQAAEKPNFIVIFTDDQGYQDLGCYGSPDINTPHIDRMAKEGMRFTSFYAQTVCGPSRSSLMTGCYPLRVAKVKNKVTTHPQMHLDEVTIAEVLKEVGYTSGAFGKWDLAGHSQTKYLPELLPRKQGFDYYFGTPSSNDQIIHYIRNEEMIEKNADMALTTQRLTDEAMAFIRRSKKKPFFVYLAHPMPHVRLDASEKFKGKSKRGLYGDVIEEIDWNVGRIFEVLKAEGLDNHTYVIFTCDNGPWYLGRSKGHMRIIGPDAEAHGGSALPLRGAKTSTWEGGLRVPFIVWAPGRVPAGRVSDEIASTMDLLPTLAGLAGAKVPDDRVIDGHDIRDLIHGVDGATSPTEAYYYYQRTQLQAVRAGKWKLHVPRKIDKTWAHYSKAEDVIAVEKPLLYDLDADISESNNLAAQHPDMVARLMDYIEHARADIGDWNRVGKQARFFDPEPARPDVKAGKRQ